MPMGEKECFELGMHLGLIGNIVKDMPLSEFIAAVDRADTIMPIMDPTLWMQNHKKLDELKELAIALKVFQDVVKRKDASL